jgi:hypothetical protein
MTTITPELRQAIAEAGDGPLRLIDPETNATYLLIKTGSCDPSTEHRDEGDDLTGEEMLRHMWEVMKDDWNDPRMDVYDSEKYA